MSKVIYTTIGALDPTSALTDSMLIMLEGANKTWRGTLAQLKEYIGAGGAGVTIASHAELVALQGSNSLVPGATYVLEDFTTIYDQPDWDIDGNPKSTVTTKTSANEVLALTAISTNQFSPQVHSLNYPEDYLEYNIGFVATEVMAAPAKGRITCRIDDKKNRTDYDHRTILFKRYAPGPGIWTAADFVEFNDTGGPFMEFLTFQATLCENNYIGNYAIYKALWGEPFLLASNVFTGDYCSSNTFGNYTIKNTIKNASNNQVADGFYQNIGYSLMDSNRIGAWMWGNRLKSSFHNNLIGDNFNRNTLQDFLFNTIGDEFGVNTGNAEIKDCTFGSMCAVNTFHFFYDNTVGSNFRINTCPLGSTVQNCNFGANISECSFNLFRHNTLPPNINSVDFTSGTLVAQSFTKDIVRLNTGGTLKVIYFTTSGITYGNILD